MRDPTLLGRIESANGSTVTVGLDEETLSGLVYIEGQGHRVGQIGSFVRIPQGYTSLFCLVTEAGAAAAPTEVTSPEQGRRWLTVEIVGEGHSGHSFSRGVYRYPTIGDEVHLVTEEDLSIVFGSRASREHVEVGNLSSARSIPARIDVNKLVSRHSAVVGATGSGKSTTVAGLVARLSDTTKFPAARIVMLDIHGEYGSAFESIARVFRVNPDIARGELPLEIPYWALNFDELLPLTFGALDDNARGRVSDWITNAKRGSIGLGKFGPLDAGLVNVDTALPFSLRKLWYDLRWEIDATYPKGQDQTSANAKMEHSGDPDTLSPARFTAYDGQNAVQSRSTLSIRKQLDSLASRMGDPRLKFLFDPGPWSPDKDHKVSSDLDLLLSNWLGDGTSSLHSAQFDGSSRSSG